jgi:hypothetical protein
MITPEAVDESLRVATAQARWSIGLLAVLM